MKYIQFYQENKVFDHKLMAFTEQTKIMECCGSDGVFILDGRNTLDNMINDAYSRIEQLRNIKPHLRLFKIMSGNSFMNSREIYSNFS